MRFSARCRESGRVKLASMANVVIQDRRRRNPPRANLDQWGDPRMPGLPGQMFSCRRERGVVAGNRQRLRLIDGQDPALD